MFFKQKILLLLLIVFAAAVRAETCLIDTSFNGVKSHTCYDAKNIPKSNFHKLCTVVGERMKKAVPSFEYHVKYGDGCPKGWLGYCEMQVYNEYLYETAKAARIKHSCQPTNSAMPGKWHEQKS